MQPHVHPHVYTRQEFDLEVEPPSAPSTTSRIGGASRTGSSADAKLRAVEKVGLFKKKIPPGRGNLRHLYNKTCLRRMPLDRVCCRWQVHTNLQVYIDLYKDIMPNHTAAVGTSPRSKPSRQELSAGVTRG